VTSSRYRAPILGVIAIGHSPRHDLQRAFAAHAPDARVRVVGALDGLAPHDIADLARRATESPQLVRLLDGSTREIGIEWLHPMVERLSRELADEYVRAVVIASTADFPTWRCDIPVVLPGRAVFDEVTRRSPRKRVGIVTTIERQAQVAAVRWLAEGFHPVVAWASPVKHSEIVGASDLLRDADVDLIVVDSMAHDVTYAEDIGRRTGKPVVTTLEIAAREAALCLH
jgi:AroM protein